MFVVHRVWQIRGRERNLWDLLEAGLCSRPRPLNLNDKELYVKERERVRDGPEVRPQSGTQTELSVAPET